MRYRMARIRVKVFCGDVEAAQSIRRIDNNTVRCYSDPVGRTTNAVGVVSYTNLVYQCPAGGDRVAHKMVIHVGHYKKGAVGALEHHNLRENENYSNQDIDASRTKDNLVLQQLDQSQYTATKQIIEQRAVNQVRSTSIWQSEFIISSDKTFFESMTKEEQDRFFRESYEFLAAEFGRENVTCAAVHYDELTPHMHFDFVPMTEDNKLSRKEVMTRERLIRLQDEMPAYLREKGFDVERGRRMAELAPKDRPQHIEPKEYKKALNEQIEALEGQKKQVEAEAAKVKQRSGNIQTAREELDRQAADLNKVIQGMKDLPKAERISNGKRQLTEPEYKKLYAAAQFGVVSQQQQAALKKSNRELKAENISLKERIPSVKDQLIQNEKIARADRLEAENKSMRDALQELRKMKLPDRAAELVRQALGAAKRVIQRQDQERT